MSFALYETPESGAETFEPPSKTLVYNAEGEVNQSVVYGLAFAGTPNSVFHARGILYRKDVRVEPIGHALYRVSVPYGLLDRTKPPQGQATFNFSTQGATVNVKYAREHMGSYPDTGPHHAGAINVGADGEVQGADIVIPSLKLTYTFTHPTGVVNESHARMLASVTGMTNASDFRGFAAGELLYIGSDGSDGSQSEASVGYNFIASSNESSLTIGEISGIVKEGHHYAWVEFYDAVESGKPVKRARRVNVERMYDSFDFYNAFGWN